MTVRMAVDVNGDPFPALRLGACQTVAISGTSNSSAALTAGVIRVANPQLCHINLNAAASTASAHMPQHTIEYFRVEDGDVLHVIGSSGLLHICQML
jgi:hypothetical protein